MRDSLQALRRVAANRDMRRLQLGWAASVTGSFAYMVALSVVAYRQGGGATAVGVLVLLRMLTSAVCSPVTAILADRWPRKLVMIGSDVIRAVLLVLLAAAVHAGTGLGLLALLACLIAAVSTVYPPAQAALLPQLAVTPAELTAANAVSTTIESSAIFLGPGIAGLVLAVSGPAVSVLLCAGIVAVAAVVTLGVSEPGRRATSDGDEYADGRWRTATAGLRVLASSPLLVTVVGVYALQCVVAGALTVFNVVLAVDVLHLGNAGVGYLDAAFGIGGILGGVAAAGLTGSSRLALAFAAGVLLWGIGIALVGIVDATAAVIVLLAAVGVGNTVVDVAAVTLIQRSAPEQVLGRVFGVIESILLAAIGVGSIIAPLAISAVGVQPTIVTIGLLLPVAVLLTFRRMTRLDELSDEARRRVELLQAVPIFTPLAPAVLEQLAASLESVAIAAGAPAVREGDVGDRFYVVESGRLSVTTSAAQAGAIETGGFFGEIALLRATPRTATVTAITDCRLLALDGELFIAAVTGEAQSREAADLIMSQRLAALRPAVGSL
jgi:MFS family permease